MKRVRSARGSLDYRRKQHDLSWSLENNERREAMTRPSHEWDEMGGDPHPPGGATTRGFPATHSTGNLLELHTMSQRSSRLEHCTKEDYGKTWFSTHQFRLRWSFSGVICKPSAWRCSRGVWTAPCLFQGARSDLPSQKGLSGSCKHFLSGREHFLNPEATAFRRLFSSSRAGVTALTSAKLKLLQHKRKLQQKYLESVSLPLKNTI